MGEDKISTNEAIDAALHLDGDPQKVKQFYADWAQQYNQDVNTIKRHGSSMPVVAPGWSELNCKGSITFISMALIYLWKWLSLPLLAVHTGRSLATST